MICAVFGVRNGVIGIPVQIVTMSESWILLTDLLLKDAKPLKSLKVRLSAARVRPCLANGRLLAEPLRARTA